MSSNEDSKRKRLDNVFRRLLRTDSVSSNHELLRNNLSLVCICFNEFYEVVRSKWDDSDSLIHKKYLTQFAKDRLNLERCVARTPGNFKVHIPLVLHKPVVFHADNLSEEYKSQEQQASRSTMQPLDVAKFINTTIGAPYDGKFAGLKSFLINLDIIKSIVPVEHNDLAIRCVRGRLLDLAGSYVPDSVTSFAEIKKCLTDNIKADPSRVVESRLAAIRFDNHNLTKFSEEVEKAANLLTQTFISEGIPVAKSNEMTVARVVDTCRQSARNDLVKSVLHIIRHTESGQNLQPKSRTRTETNNS